MKIFLKFLIIFFIFGKALSYELSFKGINKLSLNDLQSLTSNDIINQKSFNEDELDIIIKDLYQSDLIYDAFLVLQENKAIIEIDESKIIENIYINGNINLEDDIILTNILSKENSFINKDDLTKDIKSIKLFYSSIGFTDVNVTTLTELFSDERVNLVFEIQQGSPSKITKIDFLGNYYFSDRYLNNFISSESLSLLNIFSIGSNFDNNLFDFDVRKLKNLYEEYGFFDASISYELNRISKQNFSLSFFIKENERLLINDINYKLITSSLENEFNSRSVNFIKLLNKNDNFYNFNIIKDHLSDLDDILAINNLPNHIFEFSIIEDASGYSLLFSEKILDPIYINKIEISGNVITKDITLRSKLDIQPGDYLNNEELSLMKSGFNKLKYINKTDINTSLNENLADIEITVDENTRTGSFLFGGTFSGDTGLGVGLGLKDNNVFGTGNEIDTNFNINDEQTLFSINYLQYPLLYTSLKNKYKIFNSERDLTDSYGYKVDEIGLGYSLSYDYDQNINISTGIALTNYRGHSGSNNSTVITDNIGNRDLFKFNSSIIYDTTNDLLYPTNGSLNRLYISIAPDGISDDPFYKITLNSDIYKQRKRNSNFFFISNRVGLAESFDGNLNTANVFGLGGNNFKGFDYRGIGPFDGKIYLGGNKYFTSTVGLGGNFLFDDKDNINIKLFVTTGSIWESDYTTDDSFELRTSAGASFDILTAVFPISFSYAVPIKKNSKDKNREFNFNIGTSF